MSSSGSPDFPVANRHPTRYSIPRMKHLLDFEKPYIDLQRKLEDLREHPDEDNLNVDIGDEIRQLEEKIESKKKELYSNLTAWQRVQLARHPQRPYSLD